MFRASRESLHWDLSTAPETTGYRSFGGYISDVEVKDADNAGKHIDIFDGNAVIDIVQRVIVHSNYDYNVNSSVVVKVEGSTILSRFWIAEVV